MRSLLIRTIALLLQFILSATAVHLLSLLIGQLLRPTFGVPTPPRGRSPAYSETPPTSGML